MHRVHSISTAVLLAAFASMGCAATGAAGSSESSQTEAAGVQGPGNKATDARIPELGGDPSIVRTSQISLADGIAQAEAAQGPVIEAKFELDDSGALSLSLYPAAKGLGMDAERNQFEELAGDPKAVPFHGDLEVFTDQEHLTRSARDLTLVQLSRLSVADAVGAMPEGRVVYWSIPTIRDRVAGYGVYYLTPMNHVRYRFVDGLGDWGTGWDVEELGSGPGDGAADARVPELGEDLSIVLSSKISMADALSQAEAQHGPAIEAKFELDDAGKLSLSIYPVQDISLDSERNRFFELAGDPTASPFDGATSEFTVPDVEHLTRASRDLTLVQTAALSLRDAVDLAESAVPGGFVFWAIPTIRDTRSGYGVYVYGADAAVHYLFIS